MTKKRNKIRFKETIEWYDRNAKIYAKKTALLINREQIEEFCGLVKNGLILDAGCGAGRDSREFQNRGFKVVGVDISSGLLAIAKNTYLGIDFIKGNLLNLPFKDAIFKGIWAHASLVHLENKKEVEKALQEFYRLLENQGIIHILVKKRKGRKYCITTDKISGEKRFFQYFDKNEMILIIKKAGFVILRAVTENDLAGRNVKWILILAKKVINL